MYFVAGGCTIKQAIMIMIILLECAFFHKIRVDSKELTLIAAKACTSLSGTVEEMRHLPKLNKYDQVPMFGVFPGTAYFTSIDRA